MQGRIRRRTKESWEITIDLGRDANGKRLRKYENVKGRKADVERRLRELLASVDRGLPIDTGRLTVAQFLDRWLHSLEGRLAPHTIRGYQGCARLYLVPGIGETQLARLQAVQIEEMESRLQERGLSNTTVLQVHRVLHKALEDAMRWGLVARNVGHIVAPPRKTPREMRTLNANELNRLLKATQDTLLGTVIACAAHTGLRRGEVLGLQWSDVDLGRGTISVQRAFQYVPRRGYVTTKPKSAKGRRTIPVGPQLLRILKRHLVAQSELRLAAGPAWEDQGWVFARHAGQPLSPDEVSHSFHDALGRLELPQVRLHDLRHTHATLLFAQDVHPKIVQERLGHSTISITLDIYSHVLPGLQERAVAAFETALEGVQEAAL